MDHIEKKLPYYDSINKVWKVTMEYGDEEGDAIYIASEFIKGGLIFPFHSEETKKEKYHNHCHEFSEVVEYLLKRPEYFSIAGFEEYYSKQEREMLLVLKEKLDIPGI